MQKVYLCSFADTRLGISACRFKQQAMSMGEGNRIFDEIFIYTEASLPLKFREDFKDKFYKEDGTPTRGFGYWVWKPKVILMALEQIKEGDILFYLDIGFEFNPSKLEKLKDWISEVSQNEAMSSALDGEIKFQAGGNILSYSEKYWTKMDTLVHFGLDKDEDFLNSAQFASGFIALKKTNQNIKMIEEWLDVFYKHWDFVDDSPSKLPNFDCFVENRHDQSIWSIIAKAHNVKTFPTEACTQWTKLPLRYARNKIYLPNDVIQMNIVNKMLKCKGGQITPKKLILRSLKSPFYYIKARIKPLSFLY